MLVQYDKDADAMFIKFKEGKYHESKEINANIILDIEKNGKIIGIEILNASKVLSKESLSKVTFEMLTASVATA